MIKNEAYDVCVLKADKYDIELIENKLREAFSALGIDISTFKGKKVVIKPNLVMKKSPEHAATTHPIFLSALLSLLFKAGISPTIAESPGGVYSAARLLSIYRGCGIEDEAKKYDCTLNFDVYSRRCGYDEGITSKSFDIITPIADADVIIDLAKLKSHSLTKMSGAVKNMFGTVPGIVKFEMHSAYPDINDFSSVICDICAMHMKNKSFISITDGIVGMEGDGPTGGDARQIGVILVSRDPFLSDAVAARIIGFDHNDVPILSEGVRRGYIPQSIDDIRLCGDDVNSLILNDFKLPNSQRLAELRFFSHGIMGRFFMPSPSVTKKCRGCGECAASCPEHTIKISNGRAHIDASKCIRCYCCQELCPFTAITIKRNIFINIINNFK